MRTTAMIATLTFWASVGGAWGPAADAAPASPGDRVVTPARITSPTQNIRGWTARPTGSPAAAAHPVQRPAAAARLITVQYGSAALAPSGAAPAPPVVTPPSIVVAPTVSPLAPSCCLPCRPRTQMRYAPTAAPVAYRVSVAYRPVIALGPMPSAYYVGRGILGQPKIYVPEQPIRNFLRYISP